MHNGRYAAHVSGSKGISKLFDAHPDVIPAGDTDRVHTPRFGEILERR
jgi:hypothetical protein